MRFLVDAQLPRRAAGWFDVAGHDAIRTLDLAQANRTSDSAITEQADAEQRVVVTKDADFVDSHVLRGRPAKLLLLSTGNLSNAAMQSRLQPLIPTITHESAELVSGTQRVGHQRPRVTDRERCASPYPCGFAASGCGRSFRLFRPNSSRNRFVVP